MLSKKVALFFDMIVFEECVFNDMLFAVWFVKESTSGVVLKSYIYKDSWLSNVCKDIWR